VGRQGLGLGVGALLAATDDQHAPPYSSEVALRDPEAFSVRSTASALNHAERRGLANVAGPPGACVWMATPLCHELRDALEARFLADTEESQPTDKAGG